LAGCLGPNKEFIMEKYREALERNEIDIDLLCSAIGEEPLDQKFMNMKLLAEWLNTTHRMINYNQ